MKKIILILCFYASIVNAQHPLNSWTYWSAVTDPNKVNFGGYNTSENFDEINGLTTNINSLRLSVFHDQQWELSPSSTTSVGNEPITFTVVIAANSLGDLSSHDAYIGFVEYDVNNTVTNWSSQVQQLPSGSFGWNAISVTFLPINKQTTTTKIKPRLYGNKGGGEIFIYDFSVKPGTIQRDITLGIPLGKPLPVFGKLVSNTTNFYTDPNSSATSNDWMLYHTQPASISSKLVKTAVNNLNGLKSLSMSFYSDGQWSVYPNKAFPVGPGKYTFTAIIAGNNLGLMSSPDAYISIASLNSQMVVTNWGDITTVLPGGSFGWKKISKTIDIPSGVAFIKPRIWGNKGGGEISVAYASLLPSPQASDLCIEMALRAGVPASDFNFSGITFPAKNKSLAEGWNTTNIDGKYQSGDVPYLSFECKNNSAWSIQTTSKMKIVTSPVTNYTLIANLSALALQNNAQLVLKQYNASNTLLGTQTLTIPSGTWSWSSNFKLQLTLNANSDYIIPSIEGTGNGKIFISGLSLLPVASSNANFPSNTLPSKFISLPAISASSDYLISYETGYQLSGWGAWSYNRNRISISTGTKPVEHLAVRSYNSDTWYMGPGSEKIPVAQSEKWNISIVCATRNMGRMFKTNATSNDDGGVQLGFWKYDVNGNGLNPENEMGLTLPNSTKIAGNNNWTELTYTITIDANTKFIQPTIRGWGGGEFFLYKATLSKGTLPAGAQLPVPSSTEIPPAGQFITDLKGNKSYEYINKDKYDLTITSGTGYGSDKAGTMYGFIPYGATSFNFTIRNVMSPGLNTLTDAMLPFALTYKLYYGESSTAVYTATIPASTRLDYVIPINSTDCPACFDGTKVKRGFYQLKIDETWDANTTYTLKGYGSAMVGDTTDWTGYCSNNFGLSPLPNINSDKDFIYKFLGMTWTRAGSSDITATVGDVKKLPAFSYSNSDLGGFNTYKSTWQQKLADPSFEYNYHTGNEKHCKIIEIFNEPFQFLVPQGSSFPQPYVNMLHATKQGFDLYNADPVNLNKYIMARNVFNSWDFQEADKTKSQYSDLPLGQGLYDAITVHPYNLAIYRDKAASPEANPVKAEWPTFDAWGRKTGYSWSSDDDNYSEPVPLYMNRIAQHLSITGRDIKTYKIYSTEYGWPTYPGYSWSVSYADQARYIVRSSLIQLGNYVKKVMPYRFDEIDENNVFENTFGMYRMDKNPKPSLWTYSVLAKTIGNASYDAYVNFNVKNVVCLVFKTADNKTILAAWSAAHDTYSLSLGSNVNSSSTMIDMYGNSSVPSSGNVTIGKSPVYIKLNCTPESFKTSIQSAGVTYVTEMLPQSLFDVTK